MSLYHKSRAASTLTRFNGNFFQRFLSLAIHSLWRKRPKGEATKEKMNHEELRPLEENRFQWFTCKVDAHGDNKLMNIRERV